MTLEETWLELAKLEPFVFYDGRDRYTPNNIIFDSKLPDGGTMLINDKQEGPGYICEARLTWMADRWPTWSVTPHPPSWNVGPWQATAVDPTLSRFPGISDIRRGEGGTPTEALAALALILLKSEREAKS